MEKSQKKGPRSFSPCAFVRAPLIGVLLAGSALTAQSNVVNFPNAPNTNYTQPSALGNGWVLDATQGAKNTANPQLHSGACGYYSCWGGDLAVEPSSIKGDVWTQSRGQSRDYSYQDVDFETYVFVFDANNTYGNTTSSAGGSGTVNGKLTAMTSRTNSAAGTAAASIGAGQEVSLTIGGNTATASDSKGVTKETSQTSSRIFDVSINYLFLGVTFPVNTNFVDWGSTTDKEVVLADGCTIASQSATSATVSFRSEAKGECHTTGGMMASPNSQQTNAKVVADCVSKADLSLTAYNDDMVPDDVDVVVDPDNEGN